MIAPSGGFCPPARRAEAACRVLLFHRMRTRVCGLNSTTARSEDVGCDLPQRRDVVEDPEAAAVRADDDVVVVDHEIADRRGRHVQPQRLPVIAVVERDIDLRLACRRRAGPCASDPRGRR